MKRLFILSLLMLSCAGGGKYYSTKSLKYNHVDKAHYIYKDDKITFAAQIRSGGLTGSYAYILMIYNTGDHPVNLNWTYDVLSAKYKGKLYQLKKTTNILHYPGHINPNYWINVWFRQLKEFNNVINDIEELHFQFDRENYILKRNPNAVWQ